MNDLTQLQFAWLHVANVALGLATLGVIVALLVALAVDLRHMNDSPRH